jgi:hypothetical protein
MYLAQRPFKGIPSDGPDSGNAIHHVVARRAVRFPPSEKGFAKHKDTKGTAHKMMRMMFVIHKENFDGHT